MTETGGRLHELFQRALELPAEEREAFIEHACDGDAALAASVRDLIANDPSTHERFLEGRTGPPATISTATFAPPEQIGGYRVIREIGRGGMGVVYEAEQDNPRRRVALKIVRSGVMSEGLVSRFRREAQVLAQLQHRGIAHIYESGSARIGNEDVPFFAMEFIDGHTLADHAKRNQLSVRQRLELVARVCDAVQHAHQKGIIHRDLKPGNVLVVEESTGSRGADDSGTVIDSIGQPKILDFGIARFTDADVQATVQTSTGQIVGTLAYMSPEQVEGRPEDLDTRCDVYALGVMLYSLLSGKPPHELSGLPVAEAARIIKEEEPTALGALDGALRGDIATITQKAMDKDRERRYASAGLLAEDLRRYLRDEPITARPASTVYQLRKFARRNKALVVGVAASFLLLVLGVIGTGLGLAAALRANTELEQVNVDLETANADLAQSNAELEQANENLEQVAAFQENQLVRVEVREMGSRQKAWLLDATEEDHREPLGTALDTINFTDAARATLDENILVPSIEAIDAEFEDQPIIHGRLLRAVARTRRELGLYDAAEAPALRALELHGKLSGDEAEETMRTLEELALLRLDQGQFEDAERLYRQRLDLVKQLRGEQDPLSFVAEHDLGAALRAQGDAAGAEELVRSAIEKLSALVEHDDPRLLTAKNTHGGLLGQLGRQEEAVELRREVADARRASLGMDDPLTLISIHNLALDLGESGQLDEAESLLREELEACSVVHGEEHPRTLSATTGLAWVMLQANRYEEAEPLYRGALDGYRALLGDEHPSTLATLNNLASVVDSQGRYADAEPMYREALEASRRVLGEDHPRTLMGIGNLGYVLNRMGRPEDAEPLYREALTSLHRVLGDEHPATLNAMGNLGSLLLKLGKDDEAESLLIDSLERRRSVLGPDHGLTLNAMYNLGDAMISWDKLDEAEPICLEALAAHRRVLGEDHIGTLHALMAVGNLRMKQGLHKEAEEHFRVALERRVRILGEEHPDSTLAQQRLEEAIEAQRDVPPES